MKIQAALAAFATLAVPAGLLAQAAACPAARTETRSAALPFGARLRVVNRTGAVTVAGWDRPELALTAEIRDSDQRRVEVEVTPTPGGLSVEARSQEPMLSLARGCAATPRCRLVLNVPRRLHGHVRTTNGTISAAGLQGYLHCEATNGDILLGDLAGEVRAETSNGDVRARALRARLEGGTTNGRILLEDVDGQVRMEAGEGTITARNLEGWGEGISLACANGPIDVTLGRASGDLVAQNTSGSIRVRLGHAQVLETGTHRMRVRVPGRRQKILLVTTHGNIYVH